jgi:protein phosphatase PTC2/3
MEDAHTHILALPEDKACAFLAVYDGHGGAKVAQYSCKHLHTRVANQPEFSTSPTHMCLLCSTAKNLSRLEQGNIEAAIRKGFIDFDKEMALDEDMREDLAGTTAICVIIKDDKLFCGNVGDSRAIASVNGNVETLSNDHKPNNEEERKRITAAGGWVEFNRVNGIPMADQKISMLF